MSGQKQEYNLIEHMLSLLNLLQINHIEIDQLLEGGSQAAELYASNPRDIRMIYEIMKFMDEIPGGFLIYHAEGNEQIIYANLGLLRIFQCDTVAEFRELTGNSFKGMVYPDDLESVEKSIWQQISENQYDLDYVEYRITRKDGEIRWIEDYGHFIQSDAVGGIFYVFLGDATEKRNRLVSEKEVFQKEKRQSEQKLKSLMEAFDKERALVRREQLRRLEVIEGLSVNYESILYADLETDEATPYRLSTRMKPLFGEMFQVQSFIKYVTEYVNTWVYPEDREMVGRMTEPGFIRKHITENKTYYVNYRVIEDGKIEYLQLRVVDVSKAGKVQIVIGYRKVDEEQREEQEHKKMLADALNNANLAIDAKNSFLSNISHDMRTPLNAIFGFVALAKCDRHDMDAVQGYLDRIDASSRQLLDLIDKVLEISWTESSGVYAEEMECDLQEILEEIYEFLHLQALEKDIEFKLDFSGVKHKQIYSDHQKLKQMLLYLANNAITYTKPGGMVSIAVTEQIEMLNHYATYQIVIKDTGIGISEEFLERIFEPFVREKNTTLSGIHGVGLGLSIAKNIVDMLGGTIKAQSVVGEGSTFTVTLRLRMCADAAQTAAEAPGPVSAVKLSGQRILLVEDNELNLEIETAILQEQGFFIESAENGSIAVEKVKHSRPGDFDLVLMDIQMPVMNGWQAAKAIRELDDPALANIPIIAFSANVFERDIRMSMESGMNAHLTKPIDIPLLLKTFTEILQGEKG